MIGENISHYRVLQKLGSGGMGVVYEAEDLNLNRHVALKFLLADTANDAAVRERFRREALAASTLDHQNICTIYEIGENAGLPFIAMQMLSGQSLKDKIGGKPLEGSVVLDLAIQIADALAAAHARGIIHRDIKPANIFITDAGLAKVLDFGLAKTTREHAVAVFGDASVTELTDPGGSVGTLCYMSPEQVRGKGLDARTDLFSFGTVLYEMSTGIMPFRGESSGTVADFILNRQPTPPVRLNPKVPVELENIIWKALEKDSEVRYQSAAEIRADLKRVRRDSESGNTAMVSNGHPRRLLRYGAMAALLIALVVAAAMYVSRGRNKAAPEQSQWVQLTDFADAAVNPALSADGRMMAFIRGPSTMYGPGEVYVKMLPNGDPVQLTRDGQIKMDPQFSPDGSRIAYGVVGNWDSWSVPVLGGEARPMLPNATAITWIDDHHLLFSEIKTGVHMAIVTSDESRAGSRDVYVPPREAGMAHRSSLSPDRKYVLLAEMDSLWLPCRLVPFDGSSAGRQVGPPGAACYNVAWSPDGKWMYFVSNAGGRHHIWRQAFPDGTPQQLTSGAAEEDGIAIAPDGRSLITSVGTVESTLWLKDNNSERQLTSQGFAYDPQFSPDEKEIYYRVRHSQPDAGSDDLGELYVVDVESAESRRLLPDFSVRGFSVSDDGTRIAFSATDKQGHFGLWVAAVDLRSAPQQFASAVDEDQPRFAADGELFFRVAEGGSNFLYRMKLDGSGRSKVLEQPIYGFQAISPDKRWVIIRVATKGEETPYVTEAVALSGGAPIRVCSVNCAVRWAPGGRALAMAFMSMGTTETFLVPIPPGKELPPLPAGGIKSKSELAQINGTISVPSPTGPSARPGVYAFRRIGVHRNLYRIPLP